jgi:hypothetical protein
MLSESFLPFFEWCGNTWLGTRVRDTVWAFPVIETFHLLALAVLLGTVLIVNLRVFGLGARDASGPRTARELEPWMLVSLAVLILSGIPMFLSEPMKCYESVSFPIKIGLLLVAILWHFTIQRKWQGKLTAGLSILLWAGIGVAGKGIPYV